MGTKNTGGNIDIDPTVIYSVGCSVVDGVSDHLLFTVRCHEVTFPSMSSTIEFREFSEDPGFTKTLSLGSCFQMKVSSRRRYSGHQPSGVTGRITEILIPFRTVSSRPLGGNEGGEDHTVV